MKEHPVWEVYDFLRTALLNEKYYASQLVRHTRLRLTVELALSIFASISVITGLMVINIPWGKTLWLLASVMTAILAILAPLLRFGDKERSIEIVLRKYRALNNELLELKNKIEEKKTYDEECINTFKEILKRSSKIAHEAPPLVIDKKLIKEKTDEVLNEMPPSSFFVPEAKGVKNGS